MCWAELLSVCFVQGSIDMSTVMAEMYNIGDKDRNDQLDKNEFVRVSLAFFIR